MPREAKRICRWAWCEAVCSGSYCEKHKDAAKKKQQAMRITPPNPLYKTTQWQAFRALILARDKICRMCKILASKHVDHIVALKDGGAPFDENNAQGLCHSCHSRKTALSDGRWAKKTY